MTSMHATSVTEGSLVFVDTQLFDKKKLQDENNDYEDRWLPGIVKSIEGDIIHVKIENQTSEGDSSEAGDTSMDGENEAIHELQKFKLDQIFLRNPKSIEAADDITTLAYLHEASLLQNISVRYSRQDIYSYVGSILIAVNPYQNLSPSFYGEQTIEAYRGQLLGKLSPHVYAIAEDAYSSMIRDSKNQSILVSGESGAGKTETTKFILRYFAAMGKKSSSKALSPTEEAEQTESVESQVLSSTPILEAFGNAKTLRNDNSSRFGKFIEIQFGKYGEIVGAVLRTYLLEKSRIVRQATGERNYHIFYQLLAGCPSEWKQEFKLTQADDYFYLNQSQCTTVDNVDDGKFFSYTTNAMKVIGITDEEQKSIMKLLAAILHIGNIKFIDNNDSNNSCRIDDETPLNIASTLLQLNPKDIASTFLTKKITAGREKYSVHLRADQAQTSRDSLSMLLYSRMFDWLVKRMNENINTSSAHQFIGILDIYGFESFKVNSFEQFCINLANEKLQQQYNQHIFKLSQQEYLKEKINWSTIEFNDNQACLDLIEKSKLCILNLLDEECRFPKSNEKTFAQKLYNNHLKNQYFLKPKFSDTAFTIKHYADQVTYDTTFFLDKNKDFLVPEQIQQLEKSPLPFLQTIMKNSSKTLTSEKVGTGKFTSISSQFKNSLHQLMETINSTYPHYIRCIKPNQLKQPGLFNKQQVLQQLKCGGILESIRICLEGYPTKLNYETFIERYKMLAGNHVDLGDLKKTAEKLLILIGIEEGKYQFGLTKVFLRAGQIEKVETAKQIKLSKSAVVIQKNMKKYIWQKYYRNIRQSALFLQNVHRIQNAKIILMEMIRTRFATQINKYVRGYLARKKYKRTKESCDVLQRTFRSFLAKKKMEHLSRRLQATKIIQSRIRGIFTRNVYKEMLKEAKSLDTIKKQKEGLELQVEQLQFELHAEVASKQRLEDKLEHLQQELNDKNESIKAIEISWNVKHSQMVSENEKLSRYISELESKLEKEVEENRKLKVENEQLKKIKEKEKEEFERERSKIGMSSDQVKKALEQLRKELEQERRMRIDYQNKHALMEEEKLKVKKRKELEIAWDIDKSLTTMVGGYQEKVERLMVFIMFEMNPEFCNNVIPTPAFVLYSIMKYVKNVDHERLMTLITNTLTAIVRSSNDNLLLYWFSNVAALLQLFTSEDYILSACKDYDYKTINQTISKQLQKEKYVTFDNQIIEVVDWPPPFIAFLQQLVSIFVKTYTLITVGLFDKLSKILKSSLLDTLTKPTSPGYSEQESELTFQDLETTIESYFDAMKQNYLSDRIINKLMMQALRFVDATILNDILLRKELCTSNCAIQLKMNVAMLEKTVSSWTGCELSMPFVNQACQLLMMSKNLLVKQDIRMSAVPNLNNSQIYKILRNYSADEFEQPISEDTFHHFSSPGPALIELANNSSQDTLIVTRCIYVFENLSEIISQNIESELPFMSYPISVKDRLERISQEPKKQEVKKKKENIVNPSPTPKKKEGGIWSFMGIK